MSRELRYERSFRASSAHVFDLLTSPAGQREFYGNDAPGWIVDSRCELRVGGAWEIAFGPSPDGLYRHRHVFEAIERPHRLLLATTETRLDGSTLTFSTEFTFAHRGGETLLTMLQWGFASTELREEHSLGVPHAFDRLARPCRSRAFVRCGRGNRRLVVREVHLYMSMSLDGFVGSDREHPGIAIPEGDELRQWKLQQVEAAGAHLMGGTTYQEMSSFWPQSQSDYAAPMNDIPKVVFSGTLTDAEASWPVTRVARGEPAAEIAAIKDAPGADVIVWGGAALAGALAAADLIDEYRLLVQPLVLGRGQALFDQLPASRHLTLVECRPFPTGIVLQIYRRKHS